MKIMKFGRSSSKTKDSDTKPINGRNISLRDDLRTPSTKEKKYRIVSKLPQLRNVFVGRDSLLKEISEHFDAGKRILFLEGVGGIGKSELAKQYAIRNRDKYESIVFVTYLGSLRSLVCDSNAIEIDGISIRPNETDEFFFERKLQVFRAIADSKTLIIVDNFDTDEESDPDLDAFLTGSHNVIFTTRNHHPSYTSIKIDAMSTSNIAFDIFEKNYGMKIQEEDKPHLVELFSLIEYHTYTIELLAKQMAVGFYTGKELLELFITGQLSKTQTEQISGRKGKNTAFGHLCTLFSMSQLTTSECQVLRELSLIGIGGIPTKNFLRWCSINEVRQLVSNLIQKSWIRREAYNGIQYLSLHPLVIEVIRSLPETKPNEKNCRVFLGKIADDLYRSWYTPVDENLLIANAVTAIAKYFVPFEFNFDDRDLLEIWDVLPSFLWQTGRFDDAIHYGHVVYDTCLDVCGEANMLTGFAARTLAGCYYNSNRIQESIAWYKQGLKSMEASGMGDTEDLALSYEKVARCYTWDFNQDFSLAEEYFSKALQVRTNVISMITRGENVYRVEHRPEFSRKSVEHGMGQLYFEIGRLYQAKGDYYSGLTYAEKSGDTFQKSNPDDISIMAFPYFDKGVCYYHIGLEKQTSGDTAEAIRLLQLAESNLNTALNINKKMRGEVAIDTITNQEYLGDVYVALGHKEDALNAYSSTIYMLEKLFGADYERINLIKEKCDLIS